MAEFWGGGMTWLFIPSACSAASACLTKDCEPGSPTWASRIAPCATLSGKPTEPRFWLRAWKKAPWMRHLSGPMFAPSTLQRGVAEWIASLPASRAKTSLSLAGALGSTASAPGSSSRSPASQPIAVRGSSFWRTSQASLLPPPPLWTRKKGRSTNVRPPESWESWPTSAGMRNGSLFLRPTWVPVTAGPDGSAWHGAWMTPEAYAPTKEYTRDGGKKGQERLTVAGQAVHWPTPGAGDDRGASPAWDAAAARHAEKGQDKQLSLRDAAPRAMVALWPTPAQRDGDARRGATNPDSDAWKNKVSRGAVNAAGMLSDDLKSSAVHWPTPSAGVIEAKSKPPIVGNRKATDPQIGLADIAVHRFSPQARLTPPGLESSPPAPSSPRHLNPLFGAWLMGWPSTWVIAEPHASSASATELWRSALQRRLSSLLGAQ